MFEIVKHIDFCFGHRLLDYEGKCNQPHGHNGRAEIRLRAESLDGLGMVADFRDVRRTVEAWINANLDHRMILQRGDPLIDAIEGLGQRAFVMAENPTTENLARMLFQQVQQLGLPVVAVTLWETPDSYATYAPAPVGAVQANGTARAAVTSA